MGGLSISLNGETIRYEGDPGRDLLDWLRTDCELTASRFGCGQGQCGACNVLIDGRSASACVTPMGWLDGKRITTLEGLGDAERPHPLQQAFIDEQALQCGYCISGIIMSAAALLAAKPVPDETEIRQALDGHLCRCGAHGRIIRAVARASEAMRDEAARG